MKNNKKLLFGSMGILICILVILPSTVQAYPIPDPDPDPPPPPSWETGANQLYIAWGFVMSGTYTDTHAQGGGYLQVNGLPYYLNPIVGFIDFTLRFPYPSSASYSNIKLKLTALTLIGVTTFFVHYVEGGYDGLAIHGGYEEFTLDPYKRVQSIQFAGWMWMLHPNVVIDYARIVYTN